MHMIRVFFLIALLLLHTTPMLPDCVRRTVVTNGMGEQGNPFVATCASGTIVKHKFKSKWKYSIQGEKQQGASNSWAACGVMDKNPLEIEGDGECGDHKQDGTKLEEVTLPGSGFCPPSFSSDSQTMQAGEGGPMLHYATALSREQYSTGACADGGIPSVFFATCSSCACAAGGGGGGGGAVACSNDSDCPNYYCFQGYCSNYTPILIDVDGDGYSLTSAQDGVLFDFAGTGARSRISWTAVGSDDSWVALDRNGNGRIDNAMELFGNLTPQSAPIGLRNGFLALAEYDKPGNGGNGDGWISAEDRIYNLLRLWQDRNHNGVSEAEELSSLAVRSVLRIGLEHRESKWQDRYGNEFKYRAQVVRGAPGLAGLRMQWCFDVYLQPLRQPS